MDNNTNEIEFVKFIDRLNLSIVEFGEDKIEKLNAHLEEKGIVKRFTIPSISFQKTDEYSVEKTTRINQVKYYVKLHDENETNSDYKIESQYLKHFKNSKCKEIENKFKGDVFEELKDNLDICDFK